MAWIELDGAVNVRDVGGLPTEDGRRVLTRRLLRSDNLQDLSAADVRRLVADLGVTTVVDLRSPHEIAAEGPGPLTRVGSVRHARHSVLPELGTATDAAAADMFAAEVAAAALATTRREGAVSRYPDDLHGRGLVIVSRLALRCGRSGDGQSGWRVWFEMDCPPDGSPGGRPPSGPPGGLVGT